MRGGCGGGCCGFERFVESCGAGCRAVAFGAEEGVPIRLRVLPPSGTSASIGLCSDCFCAEAEKRGADVRPSERNLRSFRMFRRWSARRWIDRDSNARALLSAHAASTPTAADARTRAAAMGFEAQREK